MSTSELRGEDIISVNLNGMHIDPSSELPIHIPDENFKDCLLANLYSTVEFLKKELEEKKDTIKNLLLHAENL